MDYVAQAEAFADFLLSLPKRRKRIGNEIRGRCPTPEHDDKSPSFGYSIDKDAYACSCGSGKGSELRQRLGFIYSNGNGRSTSTQEYLERIHYYGKSRKLRFRRVDGTKRPEWQHEEDGKWVSGMGDAPGLYLIEESLGAKKLVFVESETDVECLLDLGIPATCHYRGGASEIKENEIANIRGKHLILIPHRDPTGETWQKKNIKALREGGIRRSVLSTPGEYKDIREWIEKENIDKKGVQEFLKKAVLDSSIPAPHRLSELRAAAIEFRNTPKIAPALGGLADLCRGGYLPGHTIVIGAFTSGGKTAFLCHEALSKAFLGYPVLFVSLEVSAIALTDKLLKTLQDEATADPDLWLEDRFNDLPKLCELVETWIENHSDGKPPIVCFDYAQRTKVKDQSNREREVATACESLQELAKRLKFVLILAAQLNRASQAEMEPQLHHLRESGLLEQIADTAFLVWVPEPGKWNVKLAKARWGGKVGEKLELAAEFETLTFGPISGIQKYQTLIEGVVTLLREKGPLSVRAVCNGLKFMKRHPTKSELEAASEACGMFVVNSAVVQLTQENAGNHVDQMRSTR